MPRHHAREARAGRRRRRRERQVGPPVHALFAFPSLEAVPGLVHGLPLHGERAVDVRGNLAACEQVASAHGFPALMLPRQVHGCRIADLADAPGPEIGFDGWAGDRAGMLVGVLGADCPGVLMVDPRRRVLALVHAGWRGIVAGIVPRALDVLQARHGCAPTDLRVGIGPGIGPARYEVSREVGMHIAAASTAAAVRPGRPGHAHADLAEAIAAQLRQGGVSPARVNSLRICTYEDRRWHSHRRDGERAGRHALVAGWRRPDPANT